MENEDDEDEDQDQEYDDAEDIEEVMVSIRLCAR